MTNFKIFFVLAALAFVNWSASPAQAQQAKQPPKPDIWATITNGLVLIDWTGTSLFFKEAPYPIRFTVSVNETAITSESVLKKYDFKKLLEALRVCVIKDGEFVNRDEIILQPSLGHGAPEKGCGAINITLKNGWTDGYYIVSGSLDGAAIKRNLDLVLGVPYDTQSKELRFTVRSLQTRDDKLLRLRYEVARLLFPETSCFIDTTDPLEAVNVLFQEFPNDLYGHAAAGFILQTRASTGRPEIYRSQGRSAAETPTFSGTRLIKAYSQEKQVELLQEAIKHYQVILSTLQELLPPPDTSPVRILKSVDPVELTKEAKQKFQALHFDTWFGLRGIHPLIEYFSRQVRGLEYALKARQSPYMLRSDELKTPVALLSHIVTSQDPLAQRISGNLLIPMADYIRNPPNGTLNPEIAKRELISLLNQILTGPSLYDEQLFAGVKLREETQLLLKTPRSGQELVKLNRLLSEDAYPDAIKRKTDR